MRIDRLTRVPRGQDSGHWVSLPSLCLRETTLGAFSPKNLAGGFRGLGKLSGSWKNGARASQLARIKSSRSRCMSICIQAIALIASTISEDGMCQIV